VDAVDRVEQETSQDQGASEGEREHGRAHHRITGQPHPDPWRIGADVPGCDQAASRYVIALAAAGRHEISLKQGRGRSWEARRSRSRPWWPSSSRPTPTSQQCPVPIRLLRSNVQCGVADLMPEHGK